jgi:hypothetical protein
MSISALVTRFGFLYAILSFFVFGPFKQWSGTNGLLIGGLLTLICSIISYSEYRNRNKYYLNGAKLSLSLLGMLLISLLYDVFSEWSVIIKQIALSQWYFTAIVVLLLLMWKLMFIQRAIKIVGDSADFKEKSIRGDSEINHFLQNVSTFMLREDNISLLSLALCCIIIVYAQLVLVFDFELPPIHRILIAGIIIFTFIALRLKESADLCSWDRPMPKTLGLSLLIFFASGLALNFYGVHGILALNDSFNTSGSNLSHMHVMVRDKCISTVAEKCSMRKYYRDAAFFGMWLLFSARLCWRAITCRAVSKVA